MPNKNTPAKHRTPNWKLVRARYILATKEWVWEWRAQPLQRGRKDL